MKIVYLDLSSLQGEKEDLSFLPIQRHGKFLTFSHTESSQLSSRAGDAEVIITIKNKIFSEELDQMPKLRLICQAGSGFDNIDVETAKARNITVCNLPEYGTYMVAQWTWGMILALANQFISYDQTMRTSDQWRQVAFSFPVIELQGKTLGLVGYGRIGKQVAQWASQFGMRVLVHTRSKNADPYSYADLDSLAQESDFISVHCPLNVSTRGLLGSHFLSQMKKSAYLINTARGPIVHEKALIQTLAEGRIAGAALDVFDKEPLPLSHPFMKMKNVILTPHMAWTGTDTRQRVIHQLGEVIGAFIKGTPLYKL